MNNKYPKLQKRLAIASYSFNVTNLTIYVSAN